MSTASGAPSSAPESAMGLADTSDDPSRYEIQSRKFISILRNL
jgi:hypothetical protein